MDEKDELMKLAGFIINKTTKHDLKIILDAFRYKTGGSVGRNPLADHRLAGKNELKWAVDYITGKMSPGEIELIKGAIERRMDRDSAPSLKPSGEDHGASEIINSLQKQMDGIADSIRKTTRMVAADLILTSVPDIPDEHLNVLLDQWVPASDTYKMGDRIPPEMMYAMVEQFVAYGLGKIPEEDLSDYPEGWATKYWDIFPEYIRRFTGLLLLGKIEGDVFWKKIAEYLRVEI
jgi:type III secretion system FlhB-like substrate exporter